MQKDKVSELLRKKYKNKPKYTQIQEEKNLHYKEHIFHRRDLRLLMIDHKLLFHFWNR